jgi:thiol-disulfide isomerase/thioredoxin
MIAGFAPSYARAANSCRGDRLRRSALVLLLSVVSAAGQSARPASSSPSASSEFQLSPQAAYDQAARPLDIVRQPVANWSEVELAALAVAIGQAKTECGVRSPYQYVGEDLLAYARLCAFAQMWMPVQQAATGYLIAQSAASPAEKLTGFPQLSMAFDYEIQASLHLKNVVNAFGTAQTMLRTVAYDDLASDASNSVVQYLQLIQTDQALILLEQRERLLLAMLKARGTQVPVAAVPQTRPPLSIHDLYADAIALPAMLQFAKKPEAAMAAFDEMEAALPSNLSADDAILTAASRRRYKLLGSPLPLISVSASLLDPSSSVTPSFNRKDAGPAALILFPDWCAQCVAMSPAFHEVHNRLRAKGGNFFALLAQADPRTPVSLVAEGQSERRSSGSSQVPRPPGRIGSKATVPHVEIHVGEKPPSAAELLAGTPTVIVPVGTMDTFVATDFPLLIVTDGQGIVRYLGTLPENGLVDGGLLDQVAERVMEQWPSSERPN